MNGRHPAQNDGSRRQLPFAEQGSVFQLLSQANHSAYDEPKHTRSQTEEQTIRLDRPRRNRGRLNQSEPLALLSPLQVVRSRGLDFSVEQIRVVRFGDIVVAGQRRHLLLPHRQIIQPLFQLIDVMQDPLPLHRSGVDLLVGDG